MSRRQTIKLSVAIAALAACLLFNQRVSGLQASLSPSSSSSSSSSSSAAVPPNDASPTSEAAAAAVEVAREAANNNPPLAESSNLAAVDDLLAAESSQSPDEQQQQQATGKTFTTRQETAASLAPQLQQLPYHSPPSPPQQIQQQVPVQQPQQQAPIQQQQQQPLLPQQQQARQLPVNPQQQQQQHLFQFPQLHPQQQLHGRIANQQQQQQQQHQQQVPPQVQQQKFNPFIAAALAGNYGPAQQQLAAQNLRAHQMQLAAAAAAAAQQQQQQQQQQQPHPRFIAPQLPPMAPPPPPPQQQPQQQPQQPIAEIPQQQQQQANSLAVQESAVRSNIVPAPSFVVQQQQQQQHQQADAANAIDTSAEQSGHHPVIVASASPLSQQASANTAGDQWPLPTPDIPKIVNLEVKCEKNLMKVSIEFDKVFNGIIFSKGHYSQNQCLHLNSNSNKQQAYFDISINSCGTQGNLQNGGHYGMTSANNQNSLTQQNGQQQQQGGGSFFENTIVIQYDPNVQEVWDQARKLRCTWHDHYEKAVTFRPFPVDMLDIVRADFAGDNVGCWMQIQVGKGPWASEVAGIVKIGQTMTMVLAIKDEENKFDMLVRNCFAHDGKRGPIELVDKNGCISRPKLMSKFTKIKNFGSSATVLSYAQFQAFKFPDSMEVHFQCTIQICRHQCPDQCFSSSSNSQTIGGPSGQQGGETYGESTISGTFNINGRDQAGSSGSSESTHLRKYGSQVALSREKRDLSSQNELNSTKSWFHHNSRHHGRPKPLTQTVGVNKVIQVVSTGDFEFKLPSQQLASASALIQNIDDNSEPISTTTTNMDPISGQICMSSYSFVISILALLMTLVISCFFSASLYLRHRSLTSRVSTKLSSSNNTLNYHQSSPTATINRQVPTSYQQQQHLYNQQLIN